MLKCRVCQGQKTVLGMGNMREKCLPCDGKGFISEVEPVAAKPANSKKPKGKDHDEKEIGS